MFGLTFLNAGILIASAMTLIPLLIHLFIKNKPKVVYFSSLMFLKEIFEERKKRMTINQLILLILRMLIIMFVVVAISRPVVRLPFAGRGNFHAPTAVAFILDTSPSMDYVINQKTQIQHGIDIIRNIQREMTERDMSIFFTSNTVRNSINSRLVHGTLPDREFSDIAFTWTPEPIARTITQAERELANSRFLHREIYVITDMQHTDLPDQIDTPVFFISTFTDSIRINLSIENVSIKKEPFEGALHRVAQFDVVNYSPINQRDQIVRLHLNGSTVAEKMIDLNPFERKRDMFVIYNEDLDWNSGWVEVRNERFVPDNRYFFTFYSDPEPKIGVVTNIGYIPKPIEILANIFIGENGFIDYIPQENIQLSDRERYHFLIFYLDNYSSRIQAYLQESQNNGFRTMIILHPNINDASIRFLQSFYGLVLTPMTANELLPVTAFHQWHRITGSFDFNTEMNLFAMPTALISTYRPTGRSIQPFSPLITTNQTPLILEGSDVLINIDFDVSGQNLLSHPSFPIIVYRAFSWISQFDGHMSNYLIGDMFRNRQGLLRSPTGNEYDAELVGFRFTEPGIWTYIDPIGTRSLLAVNMFDFENQSKHNPMHEILHENVSVLGSDYINRVLAQDMGNEIWKLLLWGALIFLATEMLFVVFLQKKAKV